MMLLKNNFRISQKIILGILVFSLGMNPPLGISSEDGNFRARLEAANHAASSHHFHEAFALFDRLLETHSNLLMVYQFYVEALISAREYAKATDVLQSAFKNVKDLSGDDKKWLELFLLERVEKAKAFTPVLNALPPWSEARVFGSQLFIFKTNLPAEYCKLIADQVTFYIQNGSKLLMPLLGDPVKNPRHLTVYALSRIEDENDLNKERAARNEVPVRLYSKGFFVPKTNELFIYYNGNLDSCALAIGATHYLVQEYFNLNASKFLHEGLAEYVGYKLEKRSARTQIMDELEFVNWLYDQGILDSFEKIFTWWNREGVQQAFNAVS